MQYALFIAQKEYAKYGGKDLADLLSDIIIERAKTPERNIFQIVLDESLAIASKLTIEHLDTLSLIFLLTKTKIQSIKNFNDFKNYLKKNILPFVDNLTKENKDYVYLEYLRCGQIRAGNFGQLENYFRTAYKGFFSKCFTIEELNYEFSENITDMKALLIPCLHDPTKFQFFAFDDATLNSIMTKKGFDQEQIYKTKLFFNNTTLSNLKIRQLLENFNPKMKKVFDIWNNSYFRHFELSPVGIAIAHANYKRRIGEKMDLSLWI